MKVIHISFLNNNLNSGINNVFYHYLDFQSKLIDVMGININVDVNFQENNNIVSGLSNNEIIKKIQSFKPNLIVFHGLYYKRYINIYKNLIGEVDYVIIPHGSLNKYAQKRKRIKKTLANLIFLRFVRKAKAIHYLSKYEYENSIIKHKNSFIVHNGIEINKEITKNKVNKPIKIIFLGRKTLKIKGLDLLLKTIKKYKQEFLNKVVFELYGPDRDGADKYINNYVEKNNLSDLVKNNGPVHGDIKDDLLIDSDAMIITSRSEANPMAALEALSNQLPLIASYGSAMTEFIKKHNCGWYSNSNDIDDIYKAIKNAINDIENKKIDLIQMNCLECVNKEFNWESNTQKLIDEYKNIYKKF